MFPRGFIDGCEEAEDVLFMANIIKKMGKGADGGNYYDAKPEV